MLGVFSSSIVTAPDELAAAGSRTPSPKTTASLLVDRFLRNSGGDAVSLRLGTEAFMAYTHQGQSLLRPRTFASKDDIFCLFEGALDNLPSLRQQYGLAKNVDDAVLVIEAYKTLRDRSPYPASHVVGHLDGDFPFIVLDNNTSSIFVATDQNAKVPLYWGITADGFLAFADNADLLRGSCGKSIATFPEGCFFSPRWGELKSYEHPKNKVTCVPAEEEDIWGATFTVERAPVFTAMKGTKNK